MSVTVYVVSAVLVFVFSGLLAMASLGAAFLVVVFSSLSGFLGHATLGGLDPLFLGLTAVMAAAGSIVGSTAHEAQAVEQPIEEGHRRLTVADRGQDDL